MTTVHATTDLHSEINHFYARQMHLMDARDFDGFAATFVEDGEFSHSAGQLARTRAGIVAELHDFHRRYDDDPVVRRHWFNMLAVEPEPGGGYRATFYAYTVNTRPTGAPQLGPSCVVTDVLVRVDGELLNRSRVVRQDRFLFGD